MSFLWDFLWYPSFGLLVTSALGFKARVDLACTLSCLHTIPQIHLWCSTCQPLDSQHGSLSRSLHVSAEVGCQGSNRGSLVQSTDALPTRPPCRAPSIGPTPHQTVGLDTETLCSIVYWPPCFNLAPAHLFQLSCCCEWDPPLTQGPEVRHAGGFP